MREFIHRLPKVELHVHLEGTLEPALMLKLAQRNHIALRYNTIEEVEAAFNFDDLDSFLRVYFEAAKVLITEEDFYELTMTYLKRVAAQNVRHVEPFFDPQAHTERGIDFNLIINGVNRALQDGELHYGITSRLIMCFSRHLPETSALAILEMALPYKSLISAVGLDSSEDGNPPKKFSRVFEKAREEGFLTVSHALEGPTEFMWQALDNLRVTRIDHGIRCLEDRRLSDRLKSEAIPLTICPISNVGLKAYPSLSEHPLKKIMDAGIIITLNSDDPAFFKTYIEDVYVAVQEEFGLDTKAIYQLARNAIGASFLSAIEKQRLYAELDAIYESEKLNQQILELQKRIESLSEQNKHLTALVHRLQTYDTTAIGETNPATEKPAMDEEQDPQAPQNAAPHVVMFPQARGDAAVPAVGQQQRPPAR